MMRIRRKKPSGAVPKMVIGALKRGGGAGGAQSDGSEKP
jgi:hypothetical protein